MGNWGPGVTQNDHAADLLSIETARWATELDFVINKPDSSWDQIEGPLLYVHLLALVGRDNGDLSLGSSVGRPMSSKAIATAWNERYAELYAKAPIQNAARKKVIDDTFAALIAVARDDDAPPPKKAPPRKKKGK